LRPHPLSPSPIAHPPNRERGDASEAIVASTRRYCRSNVPPLPVGVRLILANLLAEEELAGIRRTPSRETLQKASEMGGLLRAFAREGDRLWLPGDPEPEPAEEVLAWCETPRAAALRTRPREEGPLDGPLSEVLWHLPVPDPAVVARVNHRAFCLQVAEELGCALPGAQMVASIADLDRLLSSSGAWVVKAPLSAAGRSRYIERNGGPLTDSKSRRTVERLFEVHGPLLFEPWMERTADFGCAALLTSQDLRIIGFHQQVVDRKGQFAGTEIDSEIPERERMEEVLRGVAQSLRRAGYVGPFGIDAWQYRTPDGGLAFHPLGEINARMTFGLVAWATASLRAAPS
jgi:hypothetical protein